MVFHTEKYRNVIENYMVRHYVKPGITGYAQIKGFRGETKTEADMEKRIEADIFYIENWSFLLDIKIIMITVLNMLKGEKNAF
jgi:lipopolysaccharide/colanic/teichoic acid biosynthesis glycosyltransferase